MTQQTPLGLTYPEPGDHTRIWEHIQTLAEEADDLIDGMFLGDPGLVMQVGLTPSFGPSGGVSALQAVTFPVAFGAGSVRVLPPNINSGAGSASQWICRAINANSTGFTAVMYGPATTFSATATYLAIGPRP